MMKCYEYLEFLYLIPGFWILFRADIMKFIQGRKENNNDNRRKN